MNDKLNFLLRTAISAATEDRDAFIEKFSAFMEKHAGLEKEMGENAGRHLSKGLSALRSELENDALRRQPAENKAETGSILNQLEKIERKIDELEQKIDKRS